MLRICPLLPSDRIVVQDGTLLRVEGGPVIEFLGFGDSLSRGMALGQAGCKVALLMETLVLQRSERLQQVKANP